MTYSTRPPVQPRRRPGWRIVITAITAVVLAGGAAVIAPYLTAHGAAANRPTARGATERAPQFAAVTPDNGTVSNNGNGAAVPGSAGVGTPPDTSAGAAGSAGAGTAAGTANAGNLPGGAVPPGDPAGCPDVDVVFARGTGEAPGLGGTGTALMDALQADLPGKIVTSYAVNYDASFTQADVGPGATDLSNHVISVAGQCPQTTFVIGGYSQGASVVDVAIGIPPTLGQVTTIPASLASRIAAVVVFGNPLGDLSQTIASLSPVYGPKSDSFCNAGDPVCARGFNLDAHLAYATDGSAVQGAQFAAEQVDASAYEKLSSQQG